MNKCSFDLMVLIIQEMTEQLTDVRGKIKETREKVEKDFLDKDALKELFSECERYKDKLENELKEQKRKKFKRDADDYEKSKVYTWTFDQTKRGGMRRGPHHQHERGFSTAAESDSDTCNSTASTSSFLDGRLHTGTKEKPPHVGRGRGGRGRNAEEARGRRDQPRRTTRSVYP